MSLFEIIIADSPCDYCGHVGADHDGDAVTEDPEDCACSQCPDGLCRIPE